MRYGTVRYGGGTVWYIYIYIYTHTRTHTHTHTYILAIVLVSYWYKHSKVEETVTLDSKMHLQLFNMSKIPIYFCSHKFTLSKLTHIAMFLLLKKWSFYSWNACTMLNLVNFGHSNCLNRKAVNKQVFFYKTYVNVCFPV